jgi:hypothetical protein
LLENLASCLASFALFFRETELQAFKAPLLRSLSETLQELFGWRLFAVPAVILDTEWTHKISSYTLAKQIKW